MKRILTTCLLALLPALATAAAPPRIVVSLPPLHALVAGVIEGTGAAAHLLLRGGASPHSFALAPSDARALAAADLVVAADPALEGFLQRPLRSLAAEARVVWLTDVAGVQPVRTRAGGAWGEATDHGHDDEHGQQRSVDPHAWLDPRNAIALTRALGERLALLDPAHAARYRANAARRADALTALDRELARTLAPVRGRPYLVFHDGYHYLESRYGLSPVGALAVHPGRPPGARRLAAIHDRIEATGARCLFAEPQFEPRIVRVIAQATGIQTATLDPLGADLEPGAELYERLMRKLAADLVGCLQD